MSNKYDEYTAEQIITAEYDNGLTRDQIIVMLVTEKGMTLNAATKAYAAVAKDAGWSTTIVSHKDDALDFITLKLDGAPMTGIDTRTLAVELQDQFDVAESTARDYLKAWCEEAGQEFPVIDPRRAIFAWFKEQGDTADKAEFMEFATEELGRSQSNANEYWKGYELHLHLIS